MFPELVSAGSETAAVQRQVGAPSQKGVQCSRLILSFLGTFPAPDRRSKRPGPHMGLWVPSPIRAGSGLVSSFWVPSHMVKGTQNINFAFFFKLLDLIQWDNYLLGSFNTSWIKASIKGSYMPRIWAKVIFVTD